MAQDEGLAGSGWAFPHCPVPPAWSLDWDGLVARFGWLRALDGCPQDPVYHAEGDVLRHTRMVCEAMAASAAWRALVPEERSVLFAAALLHDVAKPLCTAQEGEHITARGHAVRGALLARLLLWREPPTVNAPSVEDDGAALAPLRLRTAIGALVRHHHLPVKLLEKPTPQRAVIAASQTVRCDWLALLAEADVRGRRCADQGELLEHIALFREYCAEQRCLSAPRIFPSDHSRFLYFRTPDRDPDYAAYDDTRFEVVLMAGLPGAGKSTWRQAHLADRPAIALDALRAELHAPAHGDQGPVIARAREMARELMRAERTFVWDATNTTRALRERLIDLFAAYGARIRIVYVEAPHRELLRRNRARAAPVPEPVIERLAARINVPDLTEAHAVTLVES